jgi:amino acid adenylation domain-containing protein
MINSLTTYLLTSAKRHPDKVALIHGEQTLTYAELLQAANSLAAFMQNAGVQAGDRVVVALGNSVEAILCFWATLLADAIISVVDAKQSQEKLNYILQDSGASCFISNDLELMESLSSLTLTAETVREISQQTYPAVQTRHLDIDLAAIIYTSGSTGEPKGVMLTHRNMLAASQSINTYLENTENDTVISALPLSFDYGLYQMILMFAVGGCLILESDFLLPIRFLKLIEKHQPTALPLVPSMVPLLQQFNQLKAYDLSSIRYLTNTGAALLAPHIETLQKLFTQAKIFPMYGLTECKRCSYLPPEDIQRKPGSIGRPIPNTQMWIADEEGKRLPANQVGEIVVRGATVMKGYWNKPEASKKKLIPGPLPDESLLFTGDYGSMDEEGYFYFQDRMDNVIKSRGMKVSPSEIEAIIATHDSINEVAAIGVEHEVFGHALVLFVSLKDKALTKEVIMKFAKDNLLAHQQPVEIVILSSLPKTTNGKLNKKDLHSRYSSREVA